MKRLMVAMSICFVGSAFAEKWDRYNNPKIFQPILPNKTVNYSFDTLPLEGKLKDTSLGWSESYWPANKGGIAYRWNHPNPQPFQYKILTKEEVLAMNQTELSQLSPAELYDISQSDYNFSLTKNVLGRNSPTDLWWEGICNGWSLAASRYSEPDKTVVTNKEGVKVPFGSSDVKALLAMHDSYNAQAYYVRVGRRCAAQGKVPGEATSKDTNAEMPKGILARTAHCQDVNAGAFHTILTNMIGIHSLSFVADVDRFADVWNQPLTSYQSKIIKDFPVGKGKIARKVHVATRMVFAEELIFYSKEAEADGDIHFVSKEPVTGTQFQAFKHKDYEYLLELDVNGNIIGGEWLTQTRPDFIWGRAHENEFHNTPVALGGLNQIYKPVKR